MNGYDLQASKKYWPTNWHEVYNWSHRNFKFGIHSCFVLACITRIVRSKVKTGLIKLRSEMRCMSRLILKLQGNSAHRDDHRNLRRWRHFSHFLGGPTFPSSLLPLLFHYSLRFLPYPSPVIGLQLAGLGERCRLHQRAEPAAAKRFLVQ